MISNILDPQTHSCIVSINWLKKGREKKKTKHTPGQIDVEDSWTTWKIFPLKTISFLVILSYIVQSWRTQGLRNKPSLGYLLVEIVKLMVPGGKLVGTMTNFMQFLTYDWEISFIKFCLKCNYSTYLFLTTLVLKMKHANTLTAVSILQCSKHLFLSTIAAVSRCPCKKFLVFFL